MDGTAWLEVLKVGGIYVAAGAGLAALYMARANKRLISSSAEKNEVESLRAMLAEYRLDREFLRDELDKCIAERTALGIEQESRRERRARLRIAQTEAGERRALEKLAALGALPAAA